MVVGCSPTPCQGRMGGLAATPLVLIRPRMRRSWRGRTRLACLATSSYRAEVAGSREQQLHQQPTPKTQSPSEETGSELIVATFKWPAALGGSSVSIIGSFNGWSTPLPLGRAANGDFVRSVCLPAGSIQYKYIVDDSWLSSPCEPLVSDGSGNYNNYRLVQSTATLVWKGPVNTSSPVLITGDWSSWGELLPMRRNPAAGTYTLSMCLPPGTYTYSFLVDDAWQLCSNTATGYNEAGLLANKVEVKSPPAYSIFYATGWNEAVVRVRMLNSDGTPQHPGWREVPMHNTPSRSRPKGGVWKVAVISAEQQQQQGGGGGLEFYITNGDGTREDRPQGGGAYRLYHAGGFKLRSGKVLPFPKVTQPAMMLVSDLDGTMVGDNQEADAMTAEFCQYWEENSALAGCVLVYNTGRSLGSFVHLFQEKNGALALPDFLITAVGTKIFRLDCEGGTRGTASGTLWREDLQWSRSLDAGWNLNHVKAVARGVMERLSRGRDSSPAHWLDEGTEHPHRVALSVAQWAVDEVVSQMRAGLEAGGVKAQIIISGVGDWRYVDCVSQRAGKLAALEYVRSLYSIPRDRCVAAGDSGNDTLMLGGANPAIVVGNAQPELVGWVLSQPPGPRLVMSEAPLARGLLEGLARHGLF